MGENIVGWHSRVSWRRPDAVFTLAYWLMYLMNLSKFLFNMYFYLSPFLRVVCSSDLSFIIYWITNGSLIRVVKIKWKLAQCLANTGLMTIIIFIFVINSHWNLLMHLFGGKIHSHCIKMLSKNWNDGQYYSIVLHYWAFYYKFKMMLCQNFIFGNKDLWQSKENAS